MASFARTGKSDVIARVPSRPAQACPALVKSGGGRCCAASTSSILTPPRYTSSNRRPGCPRTTNTVKDHRDAGDDGAASADIAATRRWCDSPGCSEARPECRRYGQARDGGPARGHMQVGFIPFSASTHRVPRASAGTRLARGVHPHVHRGQGQRAPAGTRHSTVVWTYLRRRARR